MRGVQNESHRKTSSYPERLTSPEHQGFQKSPLSENHSGKPPLSSLSCTSPHWHKMTLNFLLSDRTRKKPKTVSSGGRLSTLKPIQPISIENEYCYYIMIIGQPQETKSSTAAFLNFYVFLVFLFAKCPT